MNELSNIALPSDLQAFVQAQVDCGAYATHKEVVREALSLLRERHEIREMRLQKLRADLQIGLDQVTTGDVEPLRMDQIKENVRRRMAN